MNFVAIDVETANADMASICQIGIVKYENSKLTEEWKSLVNPEDYFDQMNVSVHGIDESTVSNAPTFPGLNKDIRYFLEDSIVVCHTHFDRVALNQASKRYDLIAPKCTWLDSARVTRRTWAECAWKGYGLSKVCDMLGYHFKHHDALEDAKAAAYIFLSASDKTGLSIDDWLKRVSQPIDPNMNNSSTDQRYLIKREGNPEGELYGEILVFTGALEIPRREAADLAASVGCKVDSGVTKDTTILVVGDQDLKRLSGHEKSSKHRKAEELSLKGIPIRILKESDFKELVRYSIG